MKVQLKNASHATMKRGYRKKQRPSSWSDNAVSFEAWAYDDVHYIYIDCDRSQKFKFSSVDFLSINKEMQSTLTLASLVELNSHIASLIVEKTRLLDNDRE